MTAQFEADLHPETGAPRVRLNFDNGWAVSVVLRMPEKNGTRFAMASVAACPSARWGQGETEILETEASAVEVATHIAEVMGRLPVAVAPQ